MKMEKNYMKKNRLAVIGANSFLARNFISQIDKNLSELVLYDIQDKHLDNEERYSKIDLLDREDVLNKIDFSADLIYIFSGKTGTKSGFEKYEEFISINETGLLNILWSYVKSESKSKIIYPSSRLVYKSSSTPVKEDDVLEAKSIYAVTKIACENYLKIYHDVWGVKFNIFRICVPYGTLIKNISSYGTYEFFTNQAKKGEDITLFGDGSSRRTFTHIKDLCSILASAPSLIDCDCGIYNVGGDTKSLNDIAKAISAEYSVGIKYIQWPEIDKNLEVESVVFDSTKLDRITSYKYHILNIGK